ncbi:MAG: hypothetical protein EOO40_11925, partial [Deltaproteobacteria bacterium]
MKTCLLAWCGLLFFGGMRSAAAAAESAHPLAFELAEARSFAESINAIALLDDGTYVHATLVVSNLGLKAGRGLCRVGVFAKDGTKTLRERWVDRDGWRSASLSLNIGPCEAQLTGGGIALRLPLDGSEVQMQLQGPVTNTAPPGHPVQVKDHVYASTIVQPFARATVTIKGQPAAAARSVQGFGYVDHTRSTTLPAELAYGWVRFRGFSPNCATLFLARFVAPARGSSPAQIAAYLWRRGDAAP